MTYNERLESAIVEARKRLSVVKSKMTDLEKETATRMAEFKIEAAKIEGEIIAFQYLKVEEKKRELDKPETFSRKSSILRETTLPIKAEYPNSRLGPLWTTIFAHLLAIYPGSSTVEYLKEIGSRFGKTGDSFRIPLYHHVESGSVEKLDDNMYRATPQTAEKLGVDWREKK